MKEAELFNYLNNSSCIYKIRSPFSQSRVIFSFEKLGGLQDSWSLVCSCSWCSSLVVSIFIEIFWMFWARFVGIVDFGMSRKEKDVVLTPSPDAASRIPLRELRVASKELEYSRPKQK